MQPHPFKLVVFSFASILAACGAGTEIDSSGAPLVSMLSSTAGEEMPGPLGTFESSATAPGEITRLVLMADGTAHAELIAVCQGAGAPCSPAVIDSSYKLTESDGVKQLMLFDEESSLYSCGYQYDGRVLEVAQDATREWQSLAPAPAAWCKVASQCEQQGLPVPGFAGQWACVESTCQFQSTDRAIDQDR